MKLASLAHLASLHTRRAVLGGFLGLAASAPLMTRPPLAAAQEGVTTPDGRYYDAYINAATKPGQFYHYTCEFDAAWAVMATFGYDIPFEEQLGIVGHDQSIEPYYEEGPDGFIIYGGDITSAFSGNYYDNMLARTTGKAMQPLFQNYGLQAEPVQTREAIEATLNQGGLVWMKATVDFLPWDATTWITPAGEMLPTVLGNDHAVVVMGYNAAGVVIRDVLGPTSSNWNRVYEYDVPWDLYLSVLNSQGADGLGVLPGGVAAPVAAASEPAAASEAPQHGGRSIQPAPTS